MERRDEVWKSEERAKRFINEVRPALPWADEQMEVLFRLIEARGGAINRFADLGCGDGVLSAAILDRFPESSAVLVDFSETMLKEAKKRLADRSADLRFLMADLGEEAWVDVVKDRSPFDLIVSGFCVHHQPDEVKKRIYSEIYDLLNPGGLFVIMEHVSSGSEWLESIFYDAVGDILHAFHSRKGTGKTKEQILEEMMNGPERAANILTPVEIQCQWLQDIGFEDVDCYFKMFEIAVFGGRRPKPGGGM
jgi:ubiquinone/menaquinone biosynthesis C-methylase UbiE